MLPGASVEERFKLGLDCLSRSRSSNEAVMTPYETITLTIAIVVLAGGFAYAGIQIGKWIGEKK
ncbi:hypothetical protein GCM10011494_10230 [Novosphingobium endophyticum]|uniref:Uncharacterized protein n=1 Tax=Novosphingobium endophyticum TaxID=1955250 RepID=A0A916TQH1_9SPHN|nr:hypothetical protein GCM10011494_10230 [Novosphingobium endophyticum]